MFGGGFPGFFGQQGGMSDEEDTQSKEVDNKKLYEIIGVEPGCKDQNEIKKSFRKSCLKGDYRHPDKGGNQASFKLLNEAYEILSNPEKKDIYDRSGMEGLKRFEKGGGAGGSGFEDIFSFFGGGGGQGRQRGPQKARTKLKELEVTLEEVYKGTMIPFNHTRQRNCVTCDGKGGEGVEKCQRCKGKGVVIKMVQLGPGMFSQSQSACGDCGGQGEKVEKSKICKDCKGKKVSMKTTKIEVALEPGCPDGHDILYTGEGDEGPGIMAGDLVIRIKIKPHKLFKREGADIWIEKHITLMEALIGFNFEIKHLSGQKLTLTTTQGEVTENEQIKTVKGQGMPFHKDNYQHGNLNVKFFVDFPARGQIKKEQIDILKKVLDGPAQKPLTPKDKPDFLEDYDEDLVNSHPEGGNQGRKQRNQYDEDDEDDDPRGGQRAQCQQQ